MSQNRETGASINFIKAPVFVWWIMREIFQANKIKRKAYGYINIRRKDKDCDKVKSMVKLHLE